MQSSLYPVCDYDLILRFCGYLDLCITLSCHFNIKIFWPERKYVPEYVDFHKDDTHTHTREHKKREIPYTGNPQERINSYEETGFSDSTCVYLRNGIRSEVTLRLVWRRRHETLWRRWHSLPDFGQSQARSESQICPRTPQGNEIISVWWSSYLATRRVLQGDELDFPVVSAVSAISGLTRRGKGEN